MLVDNQKSTSADLERDKLALEIAHLRHPFRNNPTHWLGVIGAIGATIAFVVQLPLTKRALHNEENAMLDKESAERHLNTIREQLANIREALPSDCLKLLNAHPLHTQAFDPAHAIRVEHSVLTLPHEGNGRLSFQAASLQPPRRWMDKSDGAIVTLHVLDAKDEILATVLDAAGAWIPDCGGYNDISEPIVFEKPFDGTMAVSIKLEILGRAGGVPCMPGS